jgi:hypothetical protein
MVPRIFVLASLGDSTPPTQSEQQSIMLKESVGANARVV